MPECFVIQPFDENKFDKRFSDVFEPAIKLAGFIPYRVDRDTAANDLVEAIKAGIERSQVFLADLTLNNPNVWFELGYALANNKPFCLVCAEDRESPYPFDIGKLKIIRYKTGSTSDFNDLGIKITDRLRAVVVLDHKLQSLAQSTAIVTDQSGLTTFEQIALSIVFQEHYSDGITTYGLQNEMERAGLNETASVLSLTMLKQKESVAIERLWDSNRDVTDTVVTATEKGVAWILSNHDKLLLTTSTNDFSGSDIASFS